jgi:hypothetical protein
MAKQKEGKRLNIFLVAGEYDPVTQEPKHPRLIMDESDLETLSKQNLGIQYIPKRWLEHENMQRDLPLLFLREKIMGIIVPSLELERIRNVREEIVLLGSLPKACSRCSRHPGLIDASRKFDEIWKNLKAAYADLISQLEIAKKKEGSL